MLLKKNVRSTYYLNNMCFSRTNGYMLILCVDCSIFLCLFKCHVTFKITIGSKCNNDHLKFNDDFKRHIMFERTQERFFFLYMITRIIMCFKDRC